MIFKELHKENVFPRCHVNGDKLDLSKPSFIEHLEEIDEAFFSLDVDWNFTYINKKAERILQKNRSDILGKNIWNGFPKAIGSSFYKNFHKSANTLKKIEFDEYYLPLNTWFRIRTCPHHNGMEIYFKDISVPKKIEKERKNDEKSMNFSMQHSQKCVDKIEFIKPFRLHHDFYQKNSESIKNKFNTDEIKFKTLFESITMGIVLIDNNGNIIQCNHSFSSLLGFLPWELENRFLKEITHPKDLGFGSDLNLQLNIEGTSNFSLEKRYIRKDQTIMWGRLTMS
ncbi:MAG: PAS domain-containing protein, partial [bacterium]